LADADIDSITDYIAMDSPSQALRWSEDVRKRCHSLGVFPKRGTVHSGEVRRLVAGAYLIFYRVTGDDADSQVIVLRVIHGAANHSGFEPDGE